jgi:hypothetical protein
MINYYATATAVLLAWLVALSLILAYVVENWR